MLLKVKGDHASCDRMARINQGSGYMVRRVLVVGVLGFASVGVWGLSLGSSAGQALMGRPLDISIPLTFAADESSSELCPVVRVYFGEDPVGAGQVRTAVKGEGSSGGAVLHVSTLSPLTEPYARVDVVAGCTNQFSRQYTILADLPSIETPKPVKAPLAVVLPSAQAVEGKDPKRPALAAAPPALDGPLTAQVTSKLTARAVQSREPLSAPKTAQQPARVVPESLSPQGARLKLDPVELVSSAAQWTPSLKMAAESDSFAVEEVNPELEQRRAAARALWRALNEDPDQLVASQAKSGVALAETQAVRQQLAAARQAEADLQAALQAERDGIYTHPVVLVLGGGLLVALGGIAVAMRRGNQVPVDKAPWWKRAEAKPPQADKPAAPVTSLPTKVKPRKKRNPFAGLTDWFENWKHNRRRRSEDDSFFPPDSLFKGGPVRREITQRAVDKGPTTMGGSEFSASSLLHGTRSVATEELFDLQQQVEFFISLGQAEQAVDVLVAHLSDSLEPSPLAYLDLLRLYHDLDRRTEYEALRKDFNRQFGGAAPAFENYSQSRRGLERYEKALSRIQNLWPTPAVLDVIEGSIFRQSSGDEQEVFDLEAYRELLLLYGIAREIIEPDSMLGTMAGASSFGYFGDSTPAPSPHTTALQPLTAQTRESFERGQASITTDQGPDTVQESRAADGQTVELDIDLSLDFDLTDSSLQQAGVTDLPIVAEMAQPSDDAMSFDLSDSMFQVEAEPAVQTTPSAHSEVSKPPPAPDVDLSLDFSALGDIENFTIRKSGVKQ